MWISLAALRLICRPEQILDELPGDPARAGAADEALKWLIPDAESSTESAFQSGFQSFGQNMALMPLGVAQTSAQAAGAAIAYAFGAVRPAPS